MSFNIMTLPSRIQIAEVRLGVLARLCRQGVVGAVLVSAGRFYTKIELLLCVSMRYIHPLRRTAYGVRQDFTLGTVVLRKGANVRDKYMEFVI